jgi:hypothetical protein
MNGKEIRGSKIAGKNESKQQQTNKKTSLLLASITKSISGKMKVR